MSEGAAAVATAPTSGASSEAPSHPASVAVSKSEAKRLRSQARANIPHGADMKKEGREAIKEARKLRLATKDGETVKDETAEIKKAEESRSEIPQKTAVKENLEVKATEEPAEKAEKKETEAEEKTPSWAQKLKTDHEAAKKRIADFEAREAKWNATLEQIKGAHEDQAEEASYWKSYAEQVEGLLKNLGHEVDPVSKKLMESERKIARFEKQKTRGDEGAKKAKQEALTKEIVDRFMGLKGRHPELDWTKNPEAKKFVERALKGDLSSLDEDVETFVSAQRWKMAQSSKPAPKTAPAEAGDAPAPSTLAGAQGGVGKKPSASASWRNLTDKQIKQMMKDRRAARA